MKKKTLFLLLFLIGFFFISDDAFALVTYKNTELQCIYGSGVQVNMRYDKSDTSEDVKHISITIGDYPVNTSVIAGDPLTNISIFDCEGNCIDKMREANFNTLKNLTCPSYITAWRATVSEVQTNGDWQTTIKGIYSFYASYDFVSNFGSHSNYITDYYKGAEGKGNDNGTGWWIFGSNATRKTNLIPINATNIKGTGNAYGSGYNNVQIPLVAERLYIVDDIGDNAYSHAFRIYRGDSNGDGKEDDAQAVGGNKYVQLYKGENSKYYLHIGKTITSLTTTEANAFNNEYICVSESTASEDASRGDGSKTFSSADHNVKPSNATIACPAGYVKYIKTTKVCKPKVDSSAGSFCDKYPNVAFVLIDIIKVMQILVPALVIVFTGIEIGRIVVAGNVEEELPKRKKSIIIRMIVMIAFLFLPIITQLIISLAEGVSILKVGCLFNDGKEPAELSEEVCEEVVKTED